MTNTEYMEQQLRKFNFLSQYWTPVQGMLPSGQGDLAP